MNDLRLMIKGSFRKSILIEIKIVSTFYITLQVDTSVYQNVICNSCLFLFLHHGIKKTKEHILHKWGFIVFYSKKLVWFYSLYRNYFILSKNTIFSNILKIFFTTLHLKIFIEYWIILHIFRLSLCVTSA